MAKRFKLRLCSLFSSCRSKDHLPSLPLRSSSLFRRHSPSPGKDANCQDDGDTLALPASPYSTSSDAFVPPQLSPLLRHGQPSRRSRTRKKKRPMRTSSTMHRPRVRNSSANSCLFSSEEGLETETEREMETLVSHSSRSFYTDSSSPHLETIREGPIITGRKKRSHAPKRSVLNNRATSGGGQERLSDVGARGSWSDGEGAPARLSAVLQRLMRCAAVEVEVEGKVRESFAVVKRSDDPYEDFRRSMAEMIAEKQMVEEAELQGLLRCFLSLNSEHHHGIIITAFHDISNAFFSNSNST